MSTLYCVGKRAWELDALGYHTVLDVPAARIPNEVAARQCRSLRAGAMIVEPSLAPALEALEPPFAFLDFETVAPAVPAWDGCHPYDTIPVQLSCHRQDGAGAYEHHAWLAEGPEDPRPRLAERVIEACAGARTVLAYNAAFERACIRRVASGLDRGRARALEDVAGRLRDLLPLVRDHVYHPEFRGSFSLKRVLPVLVPELRYDGLEIAEGCLASAELERLLFRGGALDAAERSRLRGALLRYCELDTWGTVRLFERLRQLAGGRGQDPPRPPSCST